MRSKRLAVAIVVSVLALGSLWIANADPFGREGNQTPDLSVRQDVAATVGGVTLSVLGAEFSGTSTFLEILVDAPEGVSSLMVERDAFVPGSVEPPESAGMLQLSPGLPTVVRMLPLREGQSARLVLDEVVLVSSTGGADERVVGPWVLALDTPADVATLLWVEDLPPGHAAEAHGITARPVAAVRSRNETLVTIEISGAGNVSDLMLPTTRIDGRNVGGSLVERDVATGTLIFSFPGTPRGEALVIDMRELIRPGVSVDDTFIDLAMGALIRRNALRGEFRERAVVTAEDVSSPPSIPFTVTGIDFARSSSTVTGSDVIGVTITGTFTDVRAFALVLADGSMAYPEIATTSTGTGTGGGLVQGYTRLAYRFPGMDSLDGTVRLAVGTPVEILPGPWRITFVAEDE